MTARRLITVILLLGAVDAAAASWETLFSSATDEVEARVEMKKYSFKTRKTLGERIVSAHLRTYYREGKTVSRASGDYEIHCAAREVYRSNLDMEVDYPDGKRDAVSTSAKTALSGQEYQDFAGLMAMLCARER